MITLSKDSSDRKIIVAFSYNPTLMQKIKTIPSHKWQPAEKHSSVNKICATFIKGRSYELGK